MTFTPFNRRSVQHLLGLVKQNRKIHAYKIHAHTALAGVCAFLVGCNALQEKLPFGLKDEKAIEVSKSQNTETDRSPWRLQGKAMVAVADERAAAAAIKILQNGGHAVDAAIAAHSVLGLVEPQSSGLGGGAFMVVYDRPNDIIEVYDGRETAPQATTPDLFYKDGKVMGFVEAWQSGRSVGVPGTVALYEAAFEAYGRADWGSLFAPAIELAADGFVVSARLNKSLDSDLLRRAINLDDDPQTKEYFYPDDKPLPVGFLRKNPDYAQTLRLVSAQGAGVFYKGPIAEAIVTATQKGENGGALTLEDLAAYKVIRREARCGTFRTYKICSAPAPSSGGITQSLIAGLYESLVPDANNTSDTEKLKNFVLAQQLSYADRDHYVADADFVDVPSADLLNKNYIKARAEAVHQPGEEAMAGDPGAVLYDTPFIDRWGRDESKAGKGTTHLSIVDFQGNAVSMTATVEAPFGSSRWANGFLLNNELTDFAKQAHLNGKPLANAPAAGKRPRSSMSPTIIFDASGDLHMVTGSPGGNSIIAYVAKTIKGVLDDGLSAQEAIDLPNIIARGNTVRVEIDDPSRAGLASAEALKKMGFKVQERQGENSGLHVIVAREAVFEGGADPRREGVAVEITQTE